MPTFSNPYYYDNAGVKRIEVDNMEKLTLVSTIFHRLFDHITWSKISTCLHVVLKKDRKELVRWLFPSRCYMVKEKKPDKSLQILEKLVSSEVPGLVVTREYPPKIRKKYDLDGTPMVWLSRTGIENALHPEDLPALKRLVEIFTSENNESVIFLDGIEYLIFQTSFETTIDYLNKLREIAYLSNSRMIVPLHADAVSPNQYRALKKVLSCFNN